MHNPPQSKSFSAVIWSGIDTFSRQGIQFVISVVLARLLAPAEFGLIAMLSVFIGVAATFADAGFSSALIQGRHPTQEELSSVFYFNLAMGLAITLVLALAAPWIAAFYHSPALAPLACLMALNILVSSFGSVHTALLTRDLDFRTQVRISVFATAISGLLGIGLAWRGWGVWSLAFQSLLSTFLSTCLLWRFRPWRPSWAFSLRALRRLFRFGSYLFASSLLDTFYVRFSSLLIGKWYTPADLGYFSRADSMRNVPVNALSDVVSRVAFPLFSTKGDDPEALRRGVRKAILGAMTINLPAMLGICAVARPLVLALLGAKWLPCVPYLQVLSLAGAIWPLHVINLSVLKAQGRSDLFFRLEIIKKAMGFTATIIACKISIMAAAYAVLFTGIVSLCLNSYYTGVYLGYPLSRQLRDLMPSVAAAAIMVGCVWPLNLVAGLPAATVLVAQVLVGAISYLGSSRLLGVEVFSEVIHELKVRLRRVTIKKEARYGSSIS
jgi:O-antigen/teichoic acid export membrane protein